MIVAFDTSHIISFNIIILEHTGRSPPLNLNFDGYYLITYSLLSHIFLDIDMKQRTYTDFR